MHDNVVFSKYLLIYTFTYKYSNVLLFYCNVYILSDICTIKMWNRYEQKINTLLIFYFFQVHLITKYTYKYSNKLH